MSIETWRNKSFQVIRLVSDLVMESDENSVKVIVNQAMLSGIKNFVFSVLVGAISNQSIISRLLVWCNETIRQQGGQMLFIEKDDRDECIFGALCESLRIPMYLNRDTAVVTMTENISPTSEYCSQIQDIKRQEDRRIYRRNSVNG